MFYAISVSNIGMRPTHEDNFLLNGHMIDCNVQQSMPETKSVQYEAMCRRKVNFIAVSDGMGGHKAGEVASRLCIEMLAELEDQVQDNDDLELVIAEVQDHIDELNHELCSEGEKDARLSGMGATLVLFISCGKNSAVLNIGDSRAYYFDGKSLCQLTTDHTEGQRMIELGILTRKEVEKFPARKHLNRYLGYKAFGYKLKADVTYLDLTEGTLVLCSDGISDGLSDTMINNILGENRIYEAGLILADRAGSVKNADNATIILVQMRR